MLYIVCALHCEAKPLIDFYHLSAEPDAKFPVFSNEQIKLIISGIGKVSSAVAMGYLYASGNENNYVAWLNVGIAGHKNFPLGSLLNINKVSDAATEINYYPTRLPNINVTSASAVTVDKPAEIYEGSSVWDMEASAFMATATRFTVNELIQVLKVVSDNQDHHVDNVDKSLVKKLIEQNIPEIHEVVIALQNQLEEFKAVYGEDELFKQCLQHCHFSQYQKKSLQRLLQRWRIFNVDANFQLLQQFKDSQAVIEFLQFELEKIQL